jgi:hypothetical protein
MPNLFRRCFPVVAFLVLAGLTPSQAVASQQPDTRRPAPLIAALHELREARQELQGVRDDFGPHKETAMRAINDAINSLEMLLRSKGVVIQQEERNPDWYKRYKDHPRLRQVIHDLREARDELREMWEGFGDVRDRALRDVSTAITQVEALFQKERRGNNEVKYPCMHAALHELREARQELTAARDDFGPRKEIALRAIDDAITSLKTILQVKGDNVQGIDRSPDYYRAYPNYPKLRQTLHDLREARDELRECGVDFRGLKDRALRDMSVAITQIQAMVPPSRIIPRNR